MKNNAKCIFIIFLTTLLSLPGCVEKTNHDTSKKPETKNQPDYIAEDDISNDAIITTTNDSITIKFHDTRKTTNEDLLITIEAVDKNNNEVASYYTDFINCNIDNRHFEFKYNGKFKLKNPTCQPSQEKNTTSKKSPIERFVVIYAYGGAGRIHSTRLCNNIAQPVNNNCKHR